MFNYCNNKLLCCNISELFVIIFVVISIESLLTSQTYTNRESYFNAYSPANLNSLSLF